LQHFAAVGADPTWKDVIAAVNDTIRTVAIVVGGVFAYVRFLRGRVLHPKLTLSLECKLVKLNGEGAMQVTAAWLNSGSFRMIFSESCDATLTVYAIDRAVWSKPTEAGEILWTAGKHRELDLLIKEGVKQADIVLEPGEGYETTALVPLPTGPWVAYRVDLSVVSCPRMVWKTREPLIWEQNTIVLESNGV
jgi:hypothetical protein